MNISKYPFILILVSFLNGCGGAEQAKETQSVESKSTVEEIATKNTSDSLQSFDYSRKVDSKSNVTQAIRGLRIATQAP